MISMMILSLLSTSGVTSFVPASQQRYECSIHTLQMQGDDGRRYNVVMDLIRTDRNPTWGISQDRQALRVGIVDAQSGTLVGSKFVDLPKQDFQSTQGQMHILDAQGQMSFNSVRDVSGALRDGEFDFSFQVTFKSSTLAQKSSELLRNAIEARLADLPANDREAARNELNMQLWVTDYPLTEHTGWLALKAPGRASVLRLMAQSTPSTVSHHYGQLLSDYVFLASVPQPGSPRFIAVVTRAGWNVSSQKVGAEWKWPLGYLIQTTASGTSTATLLFAEASASSTPGTFRIGAPYLGTAIRVQTQRALGQVLLNEGALPARTYVGTAELVGSVLLNRLGLQNALEFSDVIIDVTGSYVGETQVP